MTIQSFYSAWIPLAFDKLVENKMVFFFHFALLLQRRHTHTCYSGSLLIYELNINKAHEVFIKMTFTAPNCPMADEVLAEVKRNVELTPGVKSCEIELVFDPVWDTSLLSDEARITLGMD